MIRTRKTYTDLTMSIWEAIDKSVFSYSGDFVGDEKVSFHFVDGVLEMVKIEGNHKDWVFTNPQMTLTSALMEKGKKLQEKEFEAWKQGIEIVGTV